jgi:uncharacterized membrane protein YphA (DoxX/SURF4 family)
LETERFGCDSRTASNVAKNLSMLGAALLITQFGAGRVSIDDLKMDRESAADLSSE